MDCSTVDSEVMESLDFLRPPVKRIFGNNSRERTIDSNNRTPHNKVEILRNFRKKITKSSHVDNTNSTIESSTSLILKKASEREIHERHSIASYTSLIQPALNPGSDTHHTAINKPLIKVTVIPKIEQAHTGKLYRKGRHSTKGVQSTASNHENFIRTKNLYLVVAGRRKGKVYEVKTTGSAKFSSDQLKNYAKDDAYPIKDITNVKQTIQSLNMDKKKKKNKKNRNFDDDSPINQCKCFNEVNGSEVIDVDHCKSRVRIYGHVGRTEDDRYVLKCGGTVDDEPITTHYSTTERHPSPTFLRTNDVQPKFITSFNTVGFVSGCSKNDHFSKPNKDTSVQVDFRNDNPYHQQQDVGKISACKESQGTQVNFINELSSIEKVLPVQKANQIIQCNCTSIGNMKNAPSNRIDGLKESHNPLVIISVYPKQESCDIVKTIKNLEDNSRRTSPQRTNFNKNHKNAKWEDSNVQINENRTSPKPRSSRTPSPPIRTVNNRSRQDNSDVATKILRTKVTTDNYNRQSTFATINRKTHQFQNNKQESNIKLKQTDKKSIDLKKQQVQRINCTNLKSEGTKKPNTELKKALVDDYTKRITAKMDHKRPKNDISNVKINIDSDNEYYDVLFQQGKLRTDLHIKRTSKEAGSQKHYDDDDSLENLFLIPEREPRKRSLSHALYNNPAIEVMEIGNRTSRLNLRDSIEIFHRRENVHKVKDTQTDQSAKQNDHQNENTDFLAPIKHYKGDQCELPNPIDRDKEIRELLGVVNRIPSIANYKNIPRPTFGNVVEDRRLLHCVYKRKCENNISTGISLNRLCGCYNKKSSICNGVAKTKVNATQCEPAIERTSLYQQLILNRNVQVFLQVEQFCKQKPIVLSRKQYEKVKKTIQRTLSKNQDKRKKALCKCSIISVGEVRKRTKPDIPENCICDKQTQTDIKENTDSIRQDHTTNKINSEQIKISFEKKKMPEGSTDDINGNKKDSNKTKSCTRQKVQTVVLFDSKKARCSKRDVNKQCMIPARQAVSSMEIHYASMAFTKQVTFSSANVGSPLSSSFGQIKNCDSLHTIFKGHKKSPTPNLGTSVYSLISDEMNSEARSAKLLVGPRDSKPKKPFLRRLISCLVMRSRTSDLKICARPVPQPPSVNSSTDSYYISTSLGAIELTSSMYDTSASFYSNHTILPIANNKMKRSFFSSVRGFLANRKS